MEEGRRETVVFPDRSYWTIGLFKSSLCLTSKQKSKKRKKKVDTHIIQVDILIISILRFK